jgi:hypothetical protein
MYKKLYTFVQYMSRKKMVIQSSYMLFTSSQTLVRRKICLIEVNAKCRHLKNMTCKGTSQQVFIRVYRLEIQSIMLVFSTQLCELLPL